MSELKCEACGLIGGAKYVYVRTLNGGLNLCEMCLANINGKNPALNRILAAAAHVKMGRTPDEVCDGVTRAADRIMQLQDEIDRLRVAPSDDDLTAAERAMSADEEAEFGAAMWFMFGLGAVTAITIAAFVGVVVWVFC